MLLLLAALATSPDPAFPDDAIAAFVESQRDPERARIDATICRAANESGDPDYVVNYAQTNGYTVLAREALEARCAIYERGRADAAGPAPPQP